jgi:hypothetical protein
VSVRAERDRVLAEAIVRPGQQVDAKALRVVLEPVNRITGAVHALPPACLAISTGATQ